MSDRPVIVLTGGGSGGHITPILAIAKELKSESTNSKIVYIGQKGDSLADIPANNENFDSVYSVRAGKFRRYHGEGFKQFLDIPTLLKNIRDVFYVIVGYFQSWKLLRNLKPDVVFVKGGFVGVPVGLAAAMLKIPYITHDSDAIPGLANRIISRWAKLHAVALPKEVYDYPQDKTVTTGIPLQSGFEEVSKELKVKYRKSLALPDNCKLVFVIGGGLGAQRVNAAVAESVPHLLNEYRNLYVIHGVGRANEKSMAEIYNSKLSSEEQGRLRIFGYEKDLYMYSGAADVIITRAGATNLAEFALQGKACIIIPSPFLTGGHQLKNADYLAQNEAAEVLDESELQADPNRLAKIVSELLKDPDYINNLGKNLSKFAKANATKEIAALILKQKK